MTAWKSRSSEVNNCSRRGETGLSGVSRSSVQARGPHHNQKRRGNIVVQASSLQTADSHKIRVCATNSRIILAKSSCHLFWLEIADQDDIRVHGATRQSELFAVARPSKTEDTLILEMCQ